MIDTMIRMRKLENTKNIVSCLYVSNLDVFV